MMNLEFFRIFVTHTYQLSLITDVDSKHDAFIQAWTFSGPLYFDYRGEKYALVLEKFVDGEYILATLGKKSHGLMHMPPEEKFSAQEFDDWPTVPIFISLSGSPDTGQAFAVGTSNKVTIKPLLLLDAMVKKLSEEIKKSSYELNINPITKTEDFWDLVDEYKDNIEEVEFNFVAPNLFNAEQELDNELKTASQTFQATQMSVKLQNKVNGINLSESQPFTKRAAEYVSQGGGQYRMRIKGLSKTIRNGEHIKTTSIEEIELEGAISDETKLKKLCDKIFSCLDFSE